VLTGQELDAERAVRVLDAPSWYQRRQRLEELGGPPVAAEQSAGPPVAGDVSDGPPQVSAEVLAWHQREADDACKERHWSGALFHLNRLVNAQPKDGHHALYRGHVHAYLGQWEKAAADFATAAELMPNASELWEYRSLVRLRVGDTAGYREVYADMLKRFGQTRNPHIACLLARTGMRVPEPLIDPVQLVHLAKYAVAAYPKDG
jgi:hypothetical protein